MRIRAPEPGDAPAVLELIVARDIADVGEPDYTLEDVQSDWATPGLDVALDAWIVEDDGGPLGYALLDDRGAALVTVPPASEGRGVGTLLREAAEARAVARGEARVRQFVAESNAAGSAHVQAAGYELAYRYFRMRMDLAAAPEPPPGLALRAFEPGTDDAPVHALVEAAMADVPGHDPRTLEAWRAARLDREGFDPALWLLHEDAGGLAAVALCERWEDGMGYVDFLAVASRARGRGLGRAMLLHGLAALRAAGLTTAELSVQGENRSATRLYESVGMRPVWTIERWEKALGDRLTVYGKSSCSKCRDLVTLLTERGVGFDRLDFHVEGLNATRIRGLLDKAQITPRDALRRAEPLATELGLLDAGASDDEIVRRMAEHPELLQRPIVERGDRAVLARPAERVLELLDEA